MQTCVQSRGEGLYEKVVYGHPTAPEQRYAWINFEMDMIDLGTAYLEDVRSIAPKIRRLKFERSNGPEYWYHWESMNLTWFRNVELYHVVVPDGWQDGTEAGKRTTGHAQRRI